MTERFNDIKTLYANLHKETRLMIRITAISFLCMILAGIYSYTCTDKSYYYNLLLVCDDFLSASKSIIASGFFCVLMHEYIAKK